VSLRLELTPHAARQLDKLPPEVKLQVFAAFPLLVEDPHRHGVIKLSARGREWRYRVGDYRIVFTLDQRARLIEVIEIGKREDIYKKRR
jgi:mRNA interferase RelE/StbE